MLILYNISYITIKLLVSIFCQYFALLYVAHFCVFLTEVTNIVVAMANIKPERSLWLKTEPFSLGALPGPPARLTTTVSKKQYYFLHRVSEKTVQNCFCQNFVKFLSILITFGRYIKTMANITWYINIFQFNSI